MMRWMKLDNEIVINPNKITYVSNMDMIKGVEGFRIHFGREDYVFMQADEERRSTFLNALQNRINEEILS